VAKWLSAAIFRRRLSVEKARTRPDCDQALDTQLKAVATIRSAAMSRSRRRRGAGARRRERYGSDVDSRMISRVCS
jgi:hypothetical protein